MTRIREIYPMPFDRWDGEKYVHATGREYWDCVTGWCTEYEDDATCSLPVTDPKLIELEEDVLNDLLRWDEEE